MRFLLAMFLCFLSAHASAVLMNFQEFKRLPQTQQVMVLKAYKEFIASQNSEELEAKFSSFEFKLINEAYAASEFNCFYAGWPSVKKTSGGKTLCSSPFNSNPSYKAQAQACGKSQMLCNPTLFGNGLCVSTATTSLRNSAFAQCEKKFISLGQSLKSLAAKISGGELASEADEMFQLVDDICSSGFQSKTGMCRNLKNKVAAIEKHVPDSQVASTPETDNQTAIVTPDTSSIPEAQPETVSETVPKNAQVEEVVVNENLASSENQPPTRPKTEQQALREAAEQALQIPEVVANAGNVMCVPETEVKSVKTVISPDPKVPHIVCRPVQDKPLAEVDPAEVEALIKKLNITFYPSKEVVIKSKDFRLFLSEVQKFPSSLLEEMASAGSQIRLMIANSVTDDPDWKKECIKRVELAQLNANRNGNQSLVTEMAKNCNQTFDGRSWGQDIEGSGGNFMNLSYNQPTRIVLNKFYGYKKNVDGKEVQFNSGTANLFLHEHGHALDDGFGESRISNSPAWREVMDDPQVKNYLPKILSSYEHNHGHAHKHLHNKEEFVELFAYYHGCPAAKRQMEEHAPALANFLANLKSIAPFRSGPR